ncbi:hypothetical protein [Actinoplanes sp. NPDC089786]|uniref:hypothetical protein n=1 Tax=Actinoplanes sp. NPDC089786 TaxID=3155185 RepID=UPI003434E327
MSRRRWLPIIIVPVLAAAITLIGARPSLAGDAYWPGGPICATGTLTAGPRTGDPVETPLQVTITPCEGTTQAVADRGRWGLARFYDTGAELGANGYRFGIAPTFNRGTTPYGIRDGVLRLRATCLVTNQFNRLACLRIDAVGPAGTIVTQPLAVDDPLVAPTPRIVGSNNQPEPECGACV